MHVSSRQNECVPTYPTRCTAITRRLIAITGLITARPRGYIRRSKRPVKCCCTCFTQNHYSKAARCPASTSFTGACRPEPTGAYYTCYVPTHIRHVMLTLAGSKTPRISSKKPCTSCTHTKALSNGSRTKEKTLSTTSQCTYRSNPLLRPPCAVLPNQVRGFSN